jgi:DNA-binding NarL/FixJ family response regulator
VTGRRRILVIDDEPSARQVTCAQLLPEGYELRALASGAEALALLAEAPFDVVVCDVMMPGVDGVQVCRALKADRGWRHVPVILLTALSERGDVVRGLDAGADDFVTKPVDGAVLRARVRAFLRVRDAYLELQAGAEVDRRRAERVEAAGLTAREREVLELLLLGRTHEDIAVVLGISERTSKFHQANLLEKLGAESRMDLLRLFA